MRFGHWSWQQEWKTFKVSDLCQGKGDDGCAEHATSRLYGAWTSMMQRSCGQGPSNVLAYCCVRRLTEDDYSFCKGGKEPSGMACDEDEAKVRFLATTHTRIPPVLASLACLPCSPPLVLNSPCSPPLLTLAHLLCSPPQHSLSTFMPQHILLAFPPLPLVCFSAQPVHRRPR